MSSNRLTVAKALAKDERFRHVWEVPDCPGCSGHIFVQKSRQGWATGKMWECVAPWCETSDFATTEKYIPERT